MQWGNAMLIFTIWYVFLLPMIVSYGRILKKENLAILLFFDIIFMANQFINLFVGFLNKQGEYEPRLVSVIMNNWSSDFYFEIIYTFGPLMFNLDELNSAIYFLFKFPRYNRLFEIDNVVGVYLDFYGKSWTVFEITEIVKRS